MVVVSSVMEKKDMGVPAGMAVFARHGISEVSSNIIIIQNNETINQ